MGFKNGSSLRSSKSDQKSFLKIQTDFWGIIVTPFPGRTIFWVDPIYQTAAPPIAVLSCPLNILFPLGG